MQPPNKSLCLRSVFIIKIMNTRLILGTIYKNERINTKVNFFWTFLDFHLCSLVPWLGIKPELLTHLMAATPPSGQLPKGHIIKSCLKHFIYIQERTPSLLKLPRVLRKHTVSLTALYPHWFLFFTGFLHCEIPFSKRSQHWICCYETEAGRMRLPYVAPVEFCQQCIQLYSAWVS